MAGAWERMYQGFLDPSSPYRSQSILRVTPGPVMPAAPVRTTSVFSPTSYNWAAEGSGPTPLTAAQRAALTNTRAKNRKPGGVFNPAPDDVLPDDVLEDLGSTGPQDDRDAEQESTATRPFSGSATLPPLSPSELKALEDRRRASSRALQEAEIRAEDLRARAELEEIGRRLGIQEDIAQQRREGMVDLAVRGVARSPLFANPFRRELAREQQRQMAESQQTLANTLDQLNVALNAARQKREQELAQIAFDETVARSNVQRLLGIN